MQSDSGSAAIIVRTPHLSHRAHLAWLNQCLPIGCDELVDADKGGGGFPLELLPHASARWQRCSPPGLVQDLRSGGGRSGGVVRASHVRRSVRLLVRSLRPRPGGGLPCCRPVQLEGTWPAGDPFPRDLADEELSRSERSERPLLRRAAPTLNQDARQGVLLAPLGLDFLACLSEAKA